MKTTTSFRALVYSALFFGFGSVSLSAQDGKRYPLIEHFTNTYCTTCAARNPAFYDLLDDYWANIHQISYHKNSPNPNCIYYQANIAGNMARVNYYGITGTPRATLSGTVVTTSAAVMPESTFLQALDQTSPLSIVVSETGGTHRNITIEVIAHNEVAAGEYRLYAAVVEKYTDYHAPNGEKDHHNVFRKMLPSDDGEPFTPPAAGGKTTFTYNYDVLADWQPNQVYVIAFVQNVVTKEVLNSGSRFDPPLVSGLFDIDNQLSFSITPNPANDYLQVAIPGTYASLSADIYATTGEKLLHQSSLDENRLIISALSPGIYFLRVQAGDRSGVSRFVKL
jgi:hypothetical protein